MQENTKHGMADAIKITITLTEGVIFEENFSPDATFGEIAEAASHRTGIEGPVSLEAVALPLPGNLTLRDLGIDKETQLIGKADTVNVIVITGGENYHGHLSPEITMAQLAELVIAACGLIIGPNESWSIKHPGEVTGLAPTLTLATAGFKRNAKLEFSKDQYQGG